MMHTECLLPVILRLLYFPGIHNSAALLPLLSVCIRAYVLAVPCSMRHVYVDRREFDNILRSWLLAVVRRSGVVARPRPHVEGKKCRNYTRTTIPIYYQSSTYISTISTTAVFIVSATITGDHSK